MVSEVLSYLIMITCILIWVSSKEVEWTVRDTPPKLGQDLTLFCKVDNCTETKRWHGGPDKKPLMSSSGLSTDKTKYSTSIEKNGFILNILNPTIKDLNINYTCSCGLDLDNHILYIEDVYTADNLNKTTNGTFFSADNLNKTTNGTNYIGTNDVGGISLYVYIAIPVILVILLIIVIVKRHWLWGRLKEKIYGTGRRNTGNMNQVPPGRYSQPSLKPVEDILRPQSEKTSLTNKPEMENHSCSSKGDNSNDTSALEQTIERLKDEKRKVEEEFEGYKSHQTDNTGPCRTDTTKQIEQLHSENDKLREKIDVLKRKNHETSYLVQLSTQEQQMAKAKNDFNELVKKYRTEIDLQKKYHNELVELKGNIRVFCRVRPKIEEDGDGPMANNVVDYDPDDDGLIYVSNKAKTQKFEVDKVFTHSSFQAEVFDEVKALVTSCIDGYNVCIFAYGQTGCGKTFTMEGNPKNPGINPRALKALLNETSAKEDGWSFTINVSFIEIYNEIIRDLLSDNPSNKMEVKMNPDGGLYVPDLSLVVVKTIDDVSKVLKDGKQNRAIATTDMNEHSSRSHALLCVTVTAVNKITNTTTTGKLNLVDLAGSESVSKSGADGTRLKEAQNINESLSKLGDFIHALRSKQNVVPYRYSKLTCVLQDSLVGDSKTLMIVQVAPVEKRMEETISSLKFAQRVRTIELGQASKKMESGDVETV